MFLAGGFDYTWEVNELSALFAIHKVSKPLCPSVFEFHQDFDEFHIVFKLGVYHFNILLILFKKVPKIQESFLNFLS